VRGIEKGFDAARGSAYYARQVIGKVFVKWEWCDSRLPRDMDAEGYTIWRVYRAAV